jgi:hypothetical protein
VAAALALVVGLTLTAPPASAEGTEAATAPRPVSAAAAAKVAAFPAASLAQATPAAPAATTTDSRSFFKTSQGIAALVLMAVGTGLMIHSTQSDRDKVRSPIR